jgi:F0F1-type ATP synthase assembly protein I
MSFARSFALATELPIILIGAVLIAGGLGYLLDSWMHTAPLWLLILGFVGFLGGIREVLRRMKQEANRDGDK